MENSRIISIESAVLTGKRPRHAGCNARLLDHGLDVDVPLVRLTTDDGVSGFSYSRATKEQLQPMIGKPITEFADRELGVAPYANYIEFPLLDWMGHKLGKPVYQIIAEQRGLSVPESFRVQCYDTSLYIDDLHLESDDAAAGLMAEEARFGYELGHRAFKIKVGRGARHMSLDAGTRRDIAVIKAVRDAVGVDSTLMIDANNGYNLNLTKRVLAETAECNLYWVEEAFHEDRVLYEDLRTWLDKQGLNILIADGEGQASPSLMNWAQDGLIDVIQYDIFSYGFTQWLETGKQLDSWNVKSAPHHYGRHLGNTISGHLASVINNFTMVEWDEVVTKGIDTSRYTIQDGWVHIPDEAGFGITLDDAIFQTAINENGFRIKSS
jgi:L-rhamnonate dehydratase